VVGAVEAGGGVAGTHARAPVAAEPRLRSGRLDRAIRAWVVITVVVTLTYLAALLLPGDPAHTAITVVLSTVAQVPPVVVFWLVAARTGRARWEVFLAAAGLTCNAAGEIYYSLAMDSSGDLPSPSLADLGYLLCYPFVSAAVAVLVVAQSRISLRAVALDGTLAALGTAAVLGVVISPTLADPGAAATPLDGLVTALYPFFDVFVIAAVVGVAASPVLQIGPRWQFLVIGLLLFTGADIAYAFLEHSGSYRSGTPLDAAWTIAVSSGAVWAEGVQRDRLEPRVAKAGARLLPVPAAAVLAGLAVLLVATQTPVPPFALVLAAATVALSAVPVMYRHAMLARLLEGQERVVTRLIELDKSKSDMIGTVSHEMRTPLASILGYLELALDDEDGDLPEATRRLLQVADRNAHRLNILVGNMLLITQLESGGAATATAPVDLAEVLRRTTESLRLFAESKKVELSVVSAESVIVEGDEAQLERVFLNLIENAVKFTPASGSVGVEVSPATGPTGRPAVMVEITDTGMGIPADEVPLLFDRFFRATNAQTEVVPGTGLGLAIVREIVHAHQGEVSVSSVLGKGSTFRVSLPARRGDGIRQ
jgi:signal transduction histidine kinase